MPTFCRHNRFIERCPICSKTLPGRPDGKGSSRGTGPARRSSAQRSSARGATRPRRPGGESLRVHREGRAEDDGYRSTLLPGLRASADAARLAEEIAFSSGRLLALGAAPPGLYGEARELAEHDLERATWMCFLITYLSPLEGEDPFAGIRLALAGGLGDGELPPGAGELPPGAGELPPGDGELPPGAGELPPGVGELEEIPLGPRTSHDPARGVGTLIAYRQWVEHAGGPEAGAAGGAVQPSHPGVRVRAGAQASAFTGNPEWSPERRFERLFERLALPGFGRMGRYDLLVTLGRLGLYELRADSLHLSSGRGLSSSDPTTLAAKRLFAIGDPIHLERRAAALARAIAVPVETLDVALANWGSPPRATLGFPADAGDPLAFARARDALGL